MPLALAGVDWELIRELYTSGLPLSQVAMQTGVNAGTIAARASRYRWKAVALKAKSILQSAIQEESEIPNPELNSTSERVRKALANDLDASVALIQSQPPLSIKTALKRHRELEPLVRNAKTVFGWTDDSQSSLVRINILASAQVMPQEQTQAPVIDVEPASEPMVNPEKSILLPNSTGGERDAMASFDAGI